MFRSGEVVAFLVMGFALFKGYVAIAVIAAVALVAFAVADVLKLRQRARALKSGTVPGHTPNPK